MDLELSDEQRLLASSVKAFVDSELMPWEAESDRAGEVSPELGRQISEKALALGFYAANLPESVGGGGLDNASLAIMERELGKVTHALHGYVWRPTELLLACEGCLLYTSDAADE